MDLSGSEYEPVSDRLYTVMKDEEFLDKLSKDCSVE
jgi:hypothetical protein